MADEILRITRAGQETGNPYSYFPYQSDLGLVRRSPYSSNANPYLFTWIHIIGSILGHKRSQNARFIFDGRLADVGLNAVLVAWVYGYGYMGRGGEAEDEEDRAGHDEDELWVKTQGRDPKTWYSLLKKAGFKLPRVVLKTIARRRERIMDVRDDTVGEYVKNRFIC
ncbi:unnamed protein product, partial [Brenthis ino]